MRDKQKCFLGYVRVIGNNIKMIVHLKINDQYNSIEILQNIIRTYRNLGINMNESKRQPKISHQQINSIFDSLLKIPKSHKMIHPCFQRTAYSDILQWLTKSISQLLRVKTISPRQLCLKQQQIIVSTLQQLIQLCKKQCLQKGLILEMVLEYMVGTLKTHWKLLQNANRQVVYEFQNNSVKIQKEYSSQIKKLQSQNEQYRKDKEHRWRNMFMLIKDNRIHRRQNKKLKSTVNYQIQKNVVLAQQMLLLREQNQKMKLKLAFFENDPIKIESYAQTHLKLLQMQEKIKTYPKKSKKILKNELIKIQIQQINNLNDRVKFITKAIEQSGQIIDEFYDDQIIWTNFHYNISTQTEITSDDKATNTPSLKTNSIETSVQPADLSRNQIQDVCSIYVKGSKKQRKETKDRESKNVMFFSTNGFGSNNKLNLKRQQQKLKNCQTKRASQCQFAICESVKMTIYNCRISYISTYNTQIFNGPEIIKKIEQKIENEVKSSETLKKQSRQQQIQTQPQQELHTTRNFMKSPTKFTSLILSNPISIDQRIQLKKKTQSKQSKFHIYQEINFQYVPTKIKSSIFKMRKSSQPNILDKEINEMYRNNLKSSKRLNSVDRFQMNEEYVMKKLDKISSTKKISEKLDLNSQHEQNIISSIVIKNDTLFSQTNINLENRSQKASFTKETNSSGNSSFLNHMDIKKVKKQITKKSFNETTDNIALSKVKQQYIRNSQINPLNSIQQKKMPKITKSEFIRHKRNVTQSNELQNNQNEPQDKPSLKMRALHRISEVFTEADFTKDDQKDFNQKKQKIGKIPMLISRQGDIKNIDFSKAFQKIFKNIDLRRGEIISNNYTFKAYLTSYFKCVYGREIYHNFMTFLANSQPQQTTICFLKLANCKHPDPYSSDIFRALVKTISKCLALGQSPTTSKTKLQILNTLAKMFLEEDEAASFSLKMKSKCCYSLLGWFNSLQSEIRSKVLSSQLYQCLSSWLGDNNQLIASGLVSEITYFFPQTQDNFKLLIKSDLLLEQSTAIHKLSLFCNKYKWRNLLNLKTTIQIQYNKRIGSLNEQLSLQRIIKNNVILAQFKNLQKTFKIAHYCFDNYGDRIDPFLLMILQLNIQQYRLKIELPLSKQLKYLNLLYNGLQKKKEIHENKVKQENPQTKDQMFQGKI